MDYITKNINLHVIRKGFSRSTFAGDFNQIIKELRTDIFNLSEKYDKKVTFSSDFNMCIHNIIALFGYDFAKNVFTIANFSSDIVSLLDEMKLCKTHKEVLEKLDIIINGMMILLTNNNRYKMSADSFKDEITTIYNQIKNADSEHNYSSLSKFINDAYKHCLSYIKRIDNDDNYEYIIKDIDSLITYGKKQCCYIGSFIKMADVLYKQTFVDVPEEYRDTVIDYIINKNSKSDTTTIIYNYLCNIYNKCKELINGSKIRIICTEKLLDQISIIIYNYLQIFSKNIYKVMLTASNSRITSRSIYQSILFTYPNGSCPNESMLDVLKFIMLNEGDISKIILGRT